MRNYDLLIVLAIILFAFGAVYVLRKRGWMVREDPMGVLIQFATALLWDLFFLVLLFVMLLFGGVFGFFLWLASIVIAVIIVARNRLSDQRALVWSLVVAADKSIPLSTAVRAFSEERRGNLARRAGLLAKALDAGMPLDAALRKARIRLPYDSFAALRIGAHPGALHASLKSAANDSANIDLTIQSLIGQLSYLLMVLLLVGGAIAFLLIKIMPAFIKIFSDFHQRLPEAAIIVLQHSHLIGWLCGLTFVVLMIAIARYTGYLHWDPPLVRRLWSQLDQAAVLRSMALSVDQQAALPSSIDTLAQSYPKPYIQARLRRAAARVSAGSDWCDAMIDADLLRPADAGVLQASQRVGNLPWALRTTADRLVRRFLTRMSLLNSIGFPLVLLIIASIVCLLALSIFSSLATLISNLA